MCVWKVGGGGASTSVIVLYVNLNDVAQLHRIILKYHLSFLVLDICMQIATVGELILSI